VKSGYSRATFNANYAALSRSGVDRNTAIYTAACFARKCYFARFPHGALPQWLCFPKTARLSDLYDKQGKPHIIESNPSEAGLPPAALAQAKRLYRGFTGKSPRTLKRTTIPAPPKVGLAIGKILGIIYSVDATNERFKHEFSSKARPTLIVGSDGKTVYLRGGAYTFTSRGFVDSV